MLKNDDSNYGWVSIILHWLMAVSIFAMFGLGLWMVDLTYYDAWYHRAPDLHKSVGMLLLFLLIFRFIWRLMNIRPALAGLWWEKMLALAVHRLHYLLLFALLLSGYLIPTAEGAGIDVFGWFTAPATFNFDKQQADFIGKAHWLLAWAVMALAGLHSAAAIKHHVVDRDNTLLRMLGVRKTHKEA
ncbi:MAG: cytochrome b [Mariprofundaceae bacterium]|nr:cytochrome b [Mariprofundaceae bacterium]